MALFLMGSLFGSAVAAPSHPLPHQDFAGKVDVGGFSLYTEISGSENRDKGEPAIVFESGYGDDHSVWSDIQSTISQTTQTVSYDRAGLGNSDNSNVPKDAVHQVEQLHKLLKKSHVKAPYVLVVHSIGGLNARVFADEFGNELAGVVFVDSSHELMEKQVVLPYIPEEFLDLYYGQFTAEGDHDTILHIFAQAAAARANDGLRYIPIQVISATNHEQGPEAEAAWANLQDDIASLSDMSTHIVAEGSTHYVMIDQPQIVLNAIEALIHKIL